VNDAVKWQIVIVEDDPATRKLLERQLGDAGYVVRAFGDGRAALQPICEMGNGLVIADWEMPAMNGLELCAALRELHELQALGNIYYILLSAHSTKEQVVEGLAAGANDYLTKPYHPGELLARVQVGERMLRLQAELLQRNVDVQKANAQMAILANRLEQLANVDALTELPNRRCLFQRFEQLWASGRQESAPLSCVMVDVDSFKQLNDTYGHSAGDHVLKTIADAICQRVPRAELCGRFGGEEFLVLLPGLPTAEAARVADRLRADVAGLRVVYDGATITTSVSCGVAGRTPAMSCTDELVIAADALMYMAKQHGRNQVWFLGPDGRGRPLGAGPDHRGEPLVAPPPGKSVARTRDVRRRDRVQSPHAAAAHQ